MRGDVSDNDRSVAATQQNYFANVEHPELGRPDSYARFQEDAKEDFVNKSELNGQRNARGLASPYDSK